MSVKVVAVCADGTLYPVGAHNWVGHYVHIPEMCHTCGHVKVTRYFKCVSLARDRNTSVDGMQLEGSDGPPNDGTIVYAEVDKI